ncbi:hypothetical protein GCM10010399_90870 [Dactylosporangium fulvum]|uniref:Uncharacterized protein n=1 Tax=Dactylosporangium fulvum TaxID=53359 RepID=A0ABY5VT35_9ACTN|nr:hypothetical protein [Dactylosporangium fulvum]UWP80912.1 hypothetical protein Dfulv_38155 [Dactylosporangium fulvum]
MRSRVGILLAIVVLVVLWGAPGYAHGGATVTVHSDGRGSVWITAQWQDGHPINEPTPVTLTAVPVSGGGPSVGPSTLRQTGDERGTQTYGGALAPGLWQVAVDLGAPVDGHCRARVPVAAADASPAPVEVACLIPATQTSAAEPPPGTAGGSLTPLWFTLGGLAVAGAALGWFVARRRMARGEQGIPSQER